MIAFRGSNDFKVLVVLSFIFFVPLVYAQEHKRTKKKPTSTVMSPRSETLGAKFWGENCDKVSLVRAIINNCSREKLEVLIDKKADIEVQSSMGRTPLMQAVFSENNTAVNLLIERRANISHKDAGGLTPTFFAARSGKFDLLKLLLDSKANVLDVDSEGRNLLFYASFDRNEESVKLLLDSKVSPYIPNKGNQTILDILRKQSDKEKNLADWIEKEWSNTSSTSKSDIQ